MKKVKKIESRLSTISRNLQNNKNDYESSTIYKYSYVIPKRGSKKKQGKLFK